jgi:hypothetical protein
MKKEDLRLENPGQLQAYWLLNAETSEKSTGARIFPMWSIYRPLSGP